MWSPSSARIKLILPAAAAAAALIVAGCSSETSTPSGDSASVTAAMSSPSSAPQAGDFNDADVTFLQGMYPHHAQAIQMAQAVKGRTENAELIALATAIEAAQGPEMSQMSSLLTGWGKPAPTNSGGTGGNMPGSSTPGSSMPGSMPGMGHDGSGQTTTMTSGPMSGQMPGMMSDEDMSAMMGMSGAQFDTMWLNMMIRHHQGAITMSETELASGQNLEGKQLATDIISAQQAEITKMQTMLGQK